MINEIFPDFTNLPNKGNRNFEYIATKETVSESPSVSIITPFYQTGEVFLETAASILNQSFQDFEWIIVDDKSTNEVSLELLNKVAKQDKRIRILHHTENKGLPATRNTGIRNAKGKFIYLIDSDDLIEQTLLEKFYLFLSNNPTYDFVNSWSLGFNEQEYFWKRDVFTPSKFLEENQVTAACMGRKELFTALPYNETMRGGLEDWDFWLHIFSEGKKGYTINEFLFWYRRNDHAAKWDSWGDNEKRKKIIDGFRLKYETKIKTLPYFGPDLNSNYELNYPSENSIPHSHILVKNKKRVLFFMPWIELGGADKFNIDMIAGLSNDWDFTILTTLKSNNPWEPVLSSITSDIFHLPNLGPTNNIHLLIDYFIQTRNPDIIFLSNSMHIYWMLPYIKSKYPHLPVIDYIHCEDPGWMNGGYPRMSALMERFIDKTVVTSQQLKKYIQSIRKDKKDNIDVCYININVNETKANRVEREKARREWGIDDDFPIILFAARITAQKQPFVFVETIKKLFKKTENFLAIVLGNGPDFEEMKNLIKSNNLENKIWCMGAVSNTEVKRYMDIADIFFLPSLYEGIALSIYEAMAKSMAVVGADVGGQKELVTPECGYLISRSEPATEAKEYTEVLYSLIKNRNLLNTIKTNSRKRVEMYFNVEEMHHHMDTVFSDEILQKKALKSNTSNNENNADTYLLLLLAYFNQERISEELWRNLTSSKKDTTSEINNTLSHQIESHSEVEWYKNEADKIRLRYNSEYEILPLWYKRVGHVLKILKKRKLVKSVFQKD
ncbi:MAG TPA: glycosyltransferase [Bacteroidia bacterium]|jgi:glycosyltransferase involved in cell wall biosynthesis|nr:glycosyltransferase [Bacteroidia bacterium]